MYKGPREQILQIGKPSRETKRIKIIKGTSALDGISGLAGIRWTATKPTELPVYNLSELPDTIDGIGIGRRLDTGRLVLVGFYGADMLRPGLTVGMTIYSNETTTIPVAGGGSATVYLYNGIQEH